MNSPFRNVSDRSVLMIMGVGVIVGIFGLAIGATWLEDTGQRIVWVDFAMVCIDIVWCLFLIWYRRRTHNGES